jgi:hypothetical protein
MQAYNDPRVLGQYKEAPACKTKYADPLIKGGEDLLNAWRMVNERSRKRNSDPDRVRREYEKKLASPDRMQFAFIEVIGFGWYNCAIALIDHVSYDEKPAIEFKKLFKKVKTIGCDEP